MPSSHRQKPRPRSPPKGSKPAARPTRKAVTPTTKKPAPRPSSKSTAAKKPAPKGKSAEPGPELALPLPEGRRHVLSLSFVRDGDEFYARLETDSGHITELKNRSLDQLLTLVAGELEDLLD